MPYLIVPKVLSAILVANESFSIIVNYHVVIYMRRPYRLPMPVIADCIPNLSLPLNQYVQVLMTTKSFFGSILQ